MEKDFGTRRTVKIFGLLAIIHSVLFAQHDIPLSPRLNSQGVQLSLPPSNSISHISIEGDVLWIGTSKGLARSFSGGNSWESFLSIPEFASRGIFAVDLKGDTIWASTGFTPT